MNQNNLKTPQQGGWIDHNGIIQSSGGSTASQDSFISQVPLPYHLGGQDMSYTSNEINLSRQQYWSYGHEQAADHRPSFNQNSGQAYAYGQHFPGSQQLGGNMQYGLQRAASQNSNYHPYDDNQAPDLLARRQLFLSGTKTLQLHGSRDDNPNQWQTGDQSNGMQGLQYQQHPMAGTQRKYGQAHRESWKNNYDTYEIDVQHNPGFSDNELRDENYHQPTSLYRRNTHCGLRSSMGMSYQKPSNNFGKNNFDGRNGEAYTSASDDPFTQSSPLQDGGDHNTNSDASTPVLGTHNQTSTETPNGKTIRARPTLKTVRKLSQQTPLAANQSSVNSTIVSVSNGVNSVSCGPPPAFLSEGNSEPSLCSVPSATKMLAHDGRGRSNTQDPFTSGRNAAQLPKSASAGYGTSSLRPATKGLGPSFHLLTLCQNGRKPSINTAFDAANMPFVESARTHPKMRQTGLVRVSNIPYSVTRQEILAFFGRNARIVPDNEEPVHIIMERVTSKTMDAFVEFVNIHEAVKAVDRYDTQRALGYGGKLGERWVNLEVCDHEALMQELFPKTTNVKWVGIDPIIEINTDAWNSGFKGFVSREELVMLLKHVETPQRSPFARDCPQRPFECLISTLLKYPWNRLDFITIGDRDAIHETTVSLCKHLVNIIESGQHEIHIDERLLRRVKRSVFGCNGFTEAQKDDLAFVFKMTSVEAGLPPYADSWSIFKVLGAKRGWAPDIILYYMALLREATSSSAVLSLAEQSRAGNQTKALNAFGNVHIEYPADVSKMSLADVGSIEWNMIEALLREILADN